MSRKLATQVKDSRIPGKYKRVAEAYAAFANNDGTNIYPTKGKLAAKAGAASADTIYRNTPDLLDCGLLSFAQSHTCRIEACKKGRYHFAGHQGKYTTAYNFHIEMLQNAETYLSAICLKANAAKSRKVLAANCGTDSGSKETPAPASPSLGTPDSSALASGVGYLVGSGDSLRSSPTNAPPASPLSLVDGGGESSLRSEKQNPSSEPEEEREQPEIDPWTLKPVDPDLKPWNGFNGDPDPDVEEDREKTLCFWSVVRKSDIARCLGIEKFDERHVKELYAIVDVLCARNRSARWLADLVRWAKQHKFWKKTIHAGNRAVVQLAKHLSKGDICEQFDSVLGIKHGEDAFTGDYATLFTLDRENGGLAAALAKEFARKYGTGAGSYFSHEARSPMGGFDIEEA